MRVAYIEKTGRHKLRITMADGEKFILSDRDWEHFGAEAGEELEDELLQKLYQEYLLPKAKGKALNLLKIRDRSRQEMVQRLRMDGYPNEIIRQTLDYVDGYHYLDDIRFTKNYLEYRSGRKSRRELAYELKNKGIDLGTALSEAEDIEMPDDRETIEKILLSRWGDEPNPDQREKERMMRYLSRRGFGGGDILSVYRKLGI